jgi:hypothetical protein
MRWIVLIGVSFVFQVEAFWNPLKDVRDSYRSAKGEYNRELKIKKFFEVAAFSEDNIIIIPGTDQEMNIPAWAYISEYKTKGSWNQTWPFLIKKWRFSNNEYMAGFSSIVVSNFDRKKDHVDYIKRTLFSGFLGEEERSDYDFDHFPFDKACYFDYIHSKKFDIDFYIAMYHKEVNERIVSVVVVVESEFKNDVELAKWYFSRMSSMLR